MAYTIAIGGIHIESSTFTPYQSTGLDFRIKRGQELLDAYPWLKNASDDVKCVPLIHARALPGGIVSKEFYDIWLDEFTGLLKKAIEEDSMDGILLDIHGAMSVEGMMDAEGIIAEKIRDITGDDILISTSMDLHGNVSDKLFEASNLLTCYRTAPHTDQQETRQRAFDNMMEALENKRENLIKAKIDIPILLPGEKTSTQVNPGKALYGKLDEICSTDGIIDASIWMGFPWADQARCHTAVVVTGTKPEIVRHQIEKLAAEIWSARHDFEFVGQVASIDDAVEAALTSNEAPFFI